MTTLTGGHGTTSRPEKMGHYQNRDKGTPAERYQRENNLWVEPGSTAKQVVKHRAAKKRRQHNKQIIRNAIREQ